MGIFRKTAREWVCTCEWTCPEEKLSRGHLSAAVRRISYFFGLRIERAHRKTLE